MRGRYESLPPVIIITVAVGLMGALQSGIHRLTTEDWKVRLNIHPASCLAFISGLDEGMPPLPLLNVTLMLA